MAYELEIRSKKGSESIDLAAFEAAVREIGARPCGENEFLVRVGLGEVRIRFRSREQPVYVSVEFPFGAPASEVGEGLELAARLALSLALRVVDPQLLREVSSVDRVAVEQRFSELSGWSVRYAGLSGDPRSIGADSVVASNGGRTRKLLWILAMVFGALLLADVVARTFRNNARPPAYAEPGADPSGSGFTAVPGFPSK